MPSLSVTKACEAIVNLADDYENLIKLVPGLVAETKQLETQHQTAVDQAPKKHAIAATPSAESSIQNQPPPGLAPSSEARAAIRQLSAQLHEERQLAWSAPAQAPPQQATQPGQASAAGEGGISAAEAAAFDAETAAIEEKISGAEKRAQSVKRAGEAVDQALHLRGQDVSPTP
ncbi:unnamed protein product [Prorocentrum cordatum]|uniref:Mediator of RNA polymerase II transcription subunit 21 n=1 Tax=Prorocentrum cordatum TaxID=2364126 RepID=A0ABN9TA10_9DINO|nr:unnamed protein product [Polarella glacialis]